MPTPTPATALGADALAENLRDAERLVELAHRRELQPTDRSMDVQIHRLRQRLRDAGNGELFRTVRNIGYALDVDVTTVCTDA